MGTHALMELPSRLVNRYLRDGGDLVVLPVGSVEELGPHLPVGGRCFAAEAFARLLAEAGEGLHLPVVPCGPAGPTWARPGSLQVPADELNRYARALMDDLHAQGFRRIIVATFLDYTRYYLPQELFEDRSCAAVGVHLDEMIYRPEGPLCLVDDLILGSMRLLGMDGLVRKCLAENERLLGSGRDFSIKSAARKLTTGQAYAASAAREGEYPFPPRKGLSPEKGETALRTVVAKAVEALPGLRAYNEYLSRRSDRGFERGSWFRHLGEE